MLDALLDVPAAVYSPPRTEIDAAIAFIVKNLQANGALGLADPDIPDYPNYATALGVTQISKSKSANSASQLQNMAAYLRSQQFTEQNGWHPADPVYGAWAWAVSAALRRTPAPSTCR